MPVPGFLSSFADKAQNAINQTPLAGHIPGRTASPSAEPSANQAAAQGGHKSLTFETLQYQIRSLGQQYTTTAPVQRIVTIEKGVAIDCDSLARDAKAQSKELYTWGQNEDEDIRDVTDRLAYLNFVQGSLASSLALKLDSARGPLKSLRDAETNITPKRNIRAGLHNQIARMEHEQAKGAETRLSQLKEQLAKAQRDDEPLEKEIEVLKRKAVRESEKMKWEAVREFGEKLVLLSQASEPIIAALPTLPPSSANPYTGTQATGAARASLQRALDNYKTGHINLSPQGGTSELSRSDTRSFGESHASELSSIASSSTSDVTHPGIPLTPPPTDSTEKAEDVKRVTSPPIDPSALNNSPAPIPPATTPSPVPAASTKDLPPVSVPGAAPTVAETGVPVSAGSTGPGPASGSLRDLRGASDSAGPRSGGLPGNSPADDLYGQEIKHESAADEKKRLEREERERVLAAAPATSQSPPGAYESAEDEKKRMEREERERVLSGGSTGNAPGGDDDSAKGDGDQLPPYQDIQE
ncbi:Eisosome component PIL1-domain-containing protein [Hygrophoropsis aurantiaca]|uniref:Eisosome component PIL1-domain-containing protein n=1 Tax=Hygrophoropsis aurantiaca TaxID=72124 RepID=A0ACB8ASA5_9AGAM|nr:Eisosome component PIL1-domain-containing protein [Hygrophoropsis aurantiaca]